MSRSHLLLSLVVLIAAAAVADVSSAAGRAPKGHKAPKDEGPGFDRAAAAAALTGVDLAKCKATNAKRGEGHVTVTFEPTGAARQAVVDRGPMLGTPVAKCIAGQYKKVKVPAFKGTPVQVGKSFRFE